VKKIPLIFILLVIIFLAGCGHARVNYTPFLKVKLSPTDNVTLLDGKLEDVPDIFKKSSLPHLTAREKYNLAMEGVRKLTAQLGSDNYIMIGEVIGKGNAYANVEYVKAKVSKKAQSKGGHVVMIYNSGVVPENHTYTTLGYSTTNVYGSVYGGPGYATGYATGTTTYTPPQTHTETFYFPFVQGLVFRYVPGSIESRKDVEALSDTSFEKYMDFANDMLQNPEITYDDAIMRAKAFRRSLEEKDAK